MSTIIRLCLLFSDGLGILLVPLGGIKIEVCPVDTCEAAASICEALRLAVRPAVFEVSCQCPKKRSW